MKKLFNHILVPVNFNRDTQMVVGKAIAIANEFRCDVHLLHNHSPALVTPFFHARDSSPDTPGYPNADAEGRLNILAENYSHLMSEGLSITTSLATGSWFAVMKQFIITHRIDLVIIPRHIKRFLGEWLYQVNINRLARETKCPILTVTPDMDISHMKNIVVPINDFLPIRKLTAATYIARRFNAIIHLMGYKKDLHGKETGDTKWVGRAYQLLSDHTQLKIHRTATHYGNSISGKTLSYARQVEADLIVINPGKESIHGGWINHLLGRYLHRKSNIPVLTVARAVPE
ncbi:MAG: universal stress protein [Bacteroidota bacterium]|nr:universal stress protein [Bacteroidota bacterium]